MPKVRPSLQQLRLDVEAAPDSARAHLRLGTALLEVSAAQAEDAFKRALELDDTCFEAWVNLGGVRMARLDFAGAVEANSRALAIRPELVQAQFNLGLGHLYLGHPDELVGCFEKVVAVEPDNAAGHYYLAVGQLAQGRVEDARTSLQRAQTLGYQPPPEFLRALDQAEGSQGAIVMDFEPGKDPVQ